MLTSNDQLPLSPDEIVRFLVAKGMMIDCVDDAICMLTHVNAYRLRPYWLPFVRDRVTHEFWPTARFDRVIELYHFDKRLRALLLECLEPIEISLRANVARQVSLLHGPWAHEFRHVAYRKDTWPTSWLRHLAVVRNIAAHHGRVWNRVIPFQPQIPRGHGIAASVNIGVNKVYNSLVIIQHLLICINAQVHVQDRLVQLVNEHTIRLSTVGFPSDWMERSIWKGA